MFIDFTNDDVVLYMLSENKHLENPNNPNAVEVNNSIHQMNNNNINANNMQGFNVFIQYGFSPDEIRAIRMIYHLSQLRNNMANGRNLDLSLNAMYQRENNWLGNNRRNYVRINLNDNNNGRLIRRRRRYRIESNLSILQGFMVGILLNIFSIFILMIVRYRPKFKLGVLFGMIFSVTGMIIMSDSTHHIKK